MYSIHDNESFFGYYDKSPVNEDSRFLLFLSTDSRTYDIPKKGVPIQIILYDLKQEAVKKTFKTQAWNWQQGARLQWLSKYIFLYNDFDPVDEKFVAVVINAESGEEVNRFGYPVQDSFQTQYFLSLNYQRLHALRPDYGYRNLSNLSESDLQNLDGDGIWYVNFESGDGKLLLSLETIVKFEYEDRFKEGKHYVNHIMISPNGERFIFLHRYFLKGVRYDRLILSDLQGNMTLLNNYDMISHYYWWGNSNVFGYMRGMDGEDGYYMIDCETASMELYKDHELQKYGDGHPHIIENKFVTDIYPDMSRTQTLLYGDLNKKKHIVLAHLYNSIKYDGESRCDLHPRLSYDGKKVYFDTVHYKKRKLCMMDIKDINV